MNKDEVFALLREVTDPDLEDDIVSLGLVNDVSIEDDAVSISLVLGAPYSPYESRIAERVREVLGPSSLDVDLTARVNRDVPPEEQVLPNVKNVIAVASGKGGVGKSTVSVNLAAGLSRLGASVGLFDSDIYGPNVPRMVRPEEVPKVNQDETVPPEKFGVKLMSMDFFVDEDDPVIWRGPMIQKMLTRLWEDVSWGPLDYLVIDLPPGTGDAQLHLVQNIPVTGAVVVTTPQQVALDDARKGLRMFDRFDIPVLGVVENMATFECPTCGDRHDIFGRQGGEILARGDGVPFLGSVPLDPSVREGGDRGAPVVLDDDNATGDAFRVVAENVANTTGAVVRSKHSSSETDSAVPGEPTASN